MFKNRNKSNQKPQNMIRTSLTAAMIATFAHAQMYFTCNWRTANRNRQRAFMLGKQDAAAQTLTIDLQVDQLDRNEKTDSYEVDIKSTAASGAKYNAIRCEDDSTSPAPSLLIDDLFSLTAAARSFRA